MRRPAEGASARVTCTRPRRASKGFLAFALIATPAAADDWRAEVQAEYLWPIDDDRQIHTAQLHALLGQGFFDAAWIGWRAGLTASYAHGHIVQLDDQFRDVRYDNAAGAIGPTGLLRLQTPPLAGLSLGVEGSGGLLLYSRDFPAGGDIYNSMWRAGPLLESRVTQALWFGTGVHVMHVSNGQGLGPHNPSYEAHGVTLWASYSLSQARAD
jgi:hypothetical protein